MPTLPPLPGPASPDEQVVIRAAARRAEDGGDLVGARRLLALLAPTAEVQDWGRSLDAGLRCGDDGARALWQLQPAFRHGCATPLRHALHTLAADVLRTRGLAVVASEPQVASCATQDPLLVDAGLFELGMLADYLRQVLLPGRHPLRTLLQSWVGRPATVWEVRSAGAEGLALQDLRDGSTAVVAGSPPATPGDLLYGRVVPLAPGGRFTMPPILIDRVTARRVLRAMVRTAPLAERLRAVASYQRRTFATAS